jgi:hypothetical protein
MDASRSIQGDCSRRRRRDAHSLAIKDEQQAQVALAARTDTRAGCDGRIDIIKGGKGQMGVGEVGLG